MLKAPIAGAIILLISLGSGCVCKDALVIGYEKRGSFGTTRAEFDGPCTLWPKRAWNDAAFGRPFWQSVDDPWDAQRLATIEVHPGDTIGFRRGIGDGVVAFAGTSEFPLPDDDYGWYRPKNGGEAAVEGIVLAPARFVAGTAVVAAVAVTVVGLEGETSGSLKFHDH